MRGILSIILVASLAACATPEQRAVQLQREVDDLIQVYGPACERLGYKTDTDPWRDCILRLNARNSFGRGYPTTTNCFGHRGFLHCTTF